MRLLKIAALEHEIFSIITDSRARVIIYKNPTAEDYQTNAALYKEKYPLSRESKARSTKDENGNMYMWISHYVHAQIEPILSKKLGLRLDQNGYF